MTDPRGTPIADRVEQGLGDAYKGVTGQPMTPVAAQAVHHFVHLVPEELTRLGLGNLGSGNTGPGTRPGGPHEGPIKARVRAAVTTGSPRKQAGPPRVTKPVKPLMAGKPAPKPVQRASVKPRPATAVKPAKRSY